MEWHNRLQHEGLLDLIKNGLPCPTEASGWATRSELIGISRETSLLIPYSSKFSGNIGWDKEKSHGNPMELVEKQAGRWQQTSTQRPCPLPSLVPYFGFDKPTEVVHKMTVKRCAVERAYDSRRLVVRTAITQHVREGKICVNDERHGTETGVSS